MKIGALALAVLLLGCHRPAGRRAGVETCVHALEDAARHLPRERVKLLARGCPAVCPGMARYALAPERERVTALVRGCQLSCTDEVERQATQHPPAERWPRATLACGAAYYGLPAGAEPLLSPEWFVIQRVGTWLNGELAALADRALDDQAARAMSGLQLAMPLPARAPGVYDLPRAIHAAPSRAAAYVRIEPDSLSAATLPVAALGPHGAMLVAGQGGRLFGGMASPVAAADLPDRLRQLRAEAAEAGDVLLVADAAVPAATVVAAGMAVVGASPETTTDLAARLGVTTVDGEAGEHAIRFIAPRAHHFMVTVSLLDDRYSVVLADGSYNPLGRIGGEYDPLALAHYLERHPSGRSEAEPLGLMVRGQRATARDLADLLDAAAGAGVRFAVLTPGE